MGRTIGKFCIAIILAVMAGACAGGSLGGDQHAPAARANAEYILGPGDKVRITVFGEPDLSGDFEIDGAGSISLPLAGTVKAGGLSARALEGAVRDTLQGRYLVNPRVSVEALQYRPYYVYGQVGDPGEYPFTTDITVVNAIAKAGGFTPRAKRSVVYVKREDGAEEVKYRLSPTLKVQPGDTIRVGARYF